MLSQCSKLVDQWDYGECGLTLSEFSHQCCGNSKWWNSFYKLIYLILYTIALWMAVQLHYIEWSYSIIHIWKSDILLVNVQILTLFSKIQQLFPFLCNMAFVAQYSFWNNFLCVSPYYEFHAHIQVMSKGNFLKYKHWCMLILVKKKCLFTALIIPATLKSSL